MRWTSALASGVGLLLLVPASAGAEITKLGGVPDRLEPKSQFDYRVKVSELNPDGWQLIGGVVKGRDCPVEVTTDGQIDFFLDKLVDGTDWSADDDSNPRPTFKENLPGAVKGKDNYFVCVYYRDGRSGPRQLSAEQKIKVK